MTEYSPVPPETMTIMVVDDNTATRRMVRNALQRNGHHVVEAPDGRTARALIQTEHPRVVIQDLMLPDADGFELVGELRSLAVGEVSILAFSGFASKLDEARMSTVGFDDIISKPIAPSRLVPIVESHLPSRVPTSDRFGVGRRVVIADDDPLQLKLAAFRLQRYGFDVETVSNGAAALAAVRRRRPDVIVSDVMMPELDGFGLAMALRAEGSLEELPLLLVTSSYVEASDRELARRAGANDLVLRTPELGELVTLLREAIAGKRGKRPLANMSIADLEAERNRRVFRQLDKQVKLNTELAKRATSLASELAVLTGISEAVLKHRDIAVSLDEALAACFDAGGVPVGALFLLEPDGAMRARPVGSDPAWTALDLRGFFGHEDLLREVLEHKRPMFIPSPDVAPLTSAALLAACAATGILVIPLHHLDTPLGALMMVARSRELDRDAWRAFAGGVGTQLSQVLALSRAFREREEAEARSAGQAALLEAIFQSAPDFVFHIALDGTIQYANRSIRARTPAQLVGKRWADLVGPEDRLSIAVALAKVARAEVAEFESQSVGADGASVWFSTRLAPVMQGTVVVGAVVISRDVSDKKQSEMQLMLADRMASVGTLAAGVGHEINNPLASVIANLDMAAQDVSEMHAQGQWLPTDLVDELQDARDAAERVRQIVRDLKIFSRTEVDSRGPVDVKAVLESTLRMAHNEIRHRARVVRTYTNVPDVYANESRLGQVFLNLIVNAVQAIPEGDYEHNEVRVGTSVDAKGQIVVTIRDTGAGIPVEVRPRLFTPFFTTKPVGVGTGLGLAISHKIISSLDGTITFDSELGTGTEFRITLPAAVAAPDGGRRRMGPSIPPPRSRDLRRGRILVIDDEESLTHTVHRFLTQTHDVVAMTSSRAALDLLESGDRFDVILCDLMMPQVTGVEVHAVIHRLDPAQAARVVFLTGGAFTASAQDFLDASPNPRLEKPFDLRVLGDLVDSLIRGTV